MTQHEPALHRGVLWRNRRNGQPAVLHLRVSRCPQPAVRLSKPNCRSRSRDHGRAARKYLLGHCCLLQSYLGPHCCVLPPFKGARVYLRGTYEEATVNTYYDDCTRVGSGKSTRACLNKINGELLVSSSITILEASKSLDLDFDETCNRSCRADRSQPLWHP